MSQDTTLSAARELHRSGRLAEAEQAYRRILVTRPGHAEALYLLGVLLHDSGRPAEAAGELQKAARVAPGSAATHAALAAVLHTLGQVAAASRAAARAAKLQPGDARLLNLAGYLSQQAGDPARAAGYLRQAAELAPESAEAHHNLAIALHTLGRIAEAVTAYRTAALLDADNARIWFNLGLALQGSGDLDAAIDAMERCLGVSPEHVEAQYKLAWFRQLSCDWGALDAEMPVLVKALERHVDTRGAATIWPFALNSLPVSADVHDLVAGYLAEQVGERAQKPDKPRVSRTASRERLTIAYLSADFRAHAVGGLVYQLFGHHDRKRVRVLGYSLLNSADAYQETIAREVDAFRDLSAIPASEAAGMIRTDAPDILVDMSGYTEHARPELLALRPAPVQVSWVGYLNTMRAPFVDYLFADAHVMSDALVERYSEAVVELPGCFFPGSRLPVGPRPTRSEVGLPDDGFVFCSFNHTYKLDREVFRCWMDILRQVPEAVLWLYAGGMPAVAKRLEAAAESHGVAPGRVVIAPRVGIEAHLARLACADLFLDAFVYNAGATAVSAAQAGLPVLTRTGDRFMSRMGTSINRTLGLDELCVADAGQYVAAAVSLAHDSERLAAVRRRLKEPTAQSRLFDLPGRAGTLEAVYRRIWDAHRAGAAPRGFRADLPPRTSG